METAMISVLRQLPRKTRIMIRSEASGDDDPRGLRHSIAPRTKMD